jgi:RNA polymerase sigma-70 factor (ECF subfamily)
MARAEVNKTRQTLLLRLREPGDGRAWSEFAELYQPLVRKFALLRGVAEQDVDDVVQEVMRTVAKAIRTFKYDPDRGTFRDWLFVVTRSRVIRHFRKVARTPGAAPGEVAMQEMAADEAWQVGPAAEWERAYRQRMFEWAAPQVRAEVHEKTWRAFWMTSVEDRPLAEVAAALEMKPGAIYVARSRVIARLRACIQRAAGEQIGGDPLL